MITVSRTVTVYSTSLDDVNPCVVLLLRFLLRDALIIT